MYSLIDDTETFEGISKELDSLNQNMVKLQDLHENFNMFNESVSSLLYGLSINAWCTDFYEAPQTNNFANKYKVDQLNMKISQVKDKIRVLEGRGDKVKDTSLSSESTENGDDSYIISPDTAERNSDYKRPIASSSRIDKRQSRIPQLASKRVIRRKK